MQKYILSVVVQNNSGVLARVSSLFGRRGYNIDSLTVSETNNPQISRMSIIVRGDEAILEQIIKQVSKLEETISIAHLQEEEAFCKEMVFVRLLASDAQQRDGIRQVADVYNASILDSRDDSMIVQMSDVPSRIDAFIAVIGSYDILEMCRSGVTAILK